MKSVETIRCQRCDQDAPQLPKAPFRNDLGTKIHERICQSCWSDWLQHQTVLINLSGRGDKDVQTVAELEGISL